MAEATTLKPYVMVKADGTKETVYLAEGPDTNKLTLRDHVQFAYVIVGTLALAMTAYIAYLQLKNHRV